MIKPASRLAGLSLLLAPLTAVAQQAGQQPAPPPPTPPAAPSYGCGPGWMPMWGDGYGMHYGWGFGAPAMFLVFLIALVLLWFAFGRGPWRGAQYGGPPWHPADSPWRDTNQSALRILNERFAKGEIQKEEYEAKKAAIVSTGQ